MKRHVIAGMAVLALGACSGGPPTSPPQAGQPGQTSQQARATMAEQPGGREALSGTTGMSTAAASQLSAAEQGFVIDAAQNGMAEVELGRLAEQRGSTQQVRDFGRLMVRDHNQANQELMGIAQRLGITPPTSVPASGQAIQARLQQTSGTDFDRQYLEQQAAGHTAQRAMFQFAAANARNPELRAFAQRTLPVVERHLSHLRQMLPPAQRPAS